MRNKEQIPIILDKTPNPLKDRVLVKVLIENPKTNLILPSNLNKKSYSLGIVEKVGDKVKDLKEGDKVIHSNYGAIAYCINEEDYLLMNINDVFGIITENNE